MLSGIESYFSKTSKWKNEIHKLRGILLECGLDEELKWGKPCYAKNDKNIVLIQGFKDYCALLFFKGYLMKDTNGILIKTGVNTRVGRQIRFTDCKEIDKMETIIKSHVYEAIEIEESRINAPKSKDKEIIIPEELELIFNENRKFKSAFEALSPGRQRGYIFHFSAAKQSKTRVTRIEKAMKQIFEGKGLNDYK